MKNLLSFIFVFSAFQLFAQSSSGVKISDMSEQTTFPATPSSTYIPVVVDGSNRKINVTHLIGPLFTNATLSGQALNFTRYDNSSLYVDLSSLVAQTPISATLNSDQSISYFYSPGTLLNVNIFEGHANSTLPAGGLFLYSLPNSLSVVNFSNAHVTQIATIFPESLQSIDFSYCVLTQFSTPLPKGLGQLHLQHNNINSFTSSLPGNLQIADFSFNSIGSTDISQILIDLANSGSSNGFVDVSNQSPAAPPNTDGATAKATLISRGWTVITD